MGREAERVRVYTTLDLRDADPQAMRDRYSVVMQRLILEPRSLPCLEFEDV